MADTVYVSGLKELQARLTALADTVGGKKAQKPVASALRKTAVILQKAAVQNLEDGGHVLSGTLKNNIIVYKRKAPPGTVSYGVSVRSKAQKYKDNKRNQRAGRVGGTYKNYGPLFYARFLEFGTSHQPKSAFMAPAFEQHKSELPEVFRDDLSKKLDAIK